MATTTPKIPAAPKAPKAPPKSVVQRVVDQMKSATLKGKLSVDELDTIATLAGSLKVFLKP